MLESSRSQVICLIRSSRFGYVTSTPKLPWQFFDLRGSLIKKLKEKTGKDINVEIETDVNSCALLEYAQLSKG